MEERIKNIEEQLNKDPSLRKKAEKEIKELGKLNIEAPKEDEDQGGDSEEEKEEDEEDRKYQDPKMEPLLNNS